MILQIFAFNVTLGQVKLILHLILATRPRNFLGHLQTHERTRIQIVLYQISNSIFLVTNLSCTKAL